MKIKYIQLPQKSMSLMEKDRFDRFSPMHVGAILKSSDRVFQNGTNVFHDFNPYLMRIW